MLINFAINVKSNLLTKKDCADRIKGKLIYKSQDAKDQIIK